MITSRNEEKLQIVKEEIQNITNGNVAYFRCDITNSDEIKALIQTTFELNLLSYIRIIREVLPDFKKEGGRIINIASSSVKVPIQI